MIKKIRKQKGFSILSMLFFIFIVGVVGVYGFQIGMGLLDQQTIKGAVKASLVEAKSNPSASPREIKNNILRKISVSTVNISNDDVVVQKLDKGFDVDVNFQKEINITEKIKIVMDLDIEEETP